MDIGIKMPKKKKKLLSKSVAEVQWELKIGIPKSLLIVYYTLFHNTILIWNTSCQKKKKFFWITQVIKCSQWKALRKISLVGRTAIPVCLSPSVNFLLEILFSFFHIVTLIPSLRFLAVSLAQLWIKSKRK